MFRSENDQSLRVGTTGRRSLKTLSGTGHLVSWRGALPRTRNAIHQIEEILRLRHEAGRPTQGQRANRLTRALAALDRSAIKATTPFQRRNEAVATRMRSGLGGRRPMKPSDLQESSPLARKNGPRRLKSDAAGSRARNHAAMAGGFQGGVGPERDPPLGAVAPADGAAGAEAAELVAAAGEAEGPVGLEQVVSAPVFIAA